MVAASPAAAALPFLGELALPLIAAPMLRVSGIELTSAACAAGIVGAFPTLNARTAEELETWLQRLAREAMAAIDAGRTVGPFCPNIVMRQDAGLLRDIVRRCIAHRTRLVITSVGSPRSVMPMFRDAGIRVLADVASLRHVERALEAGVDGLVLLTAGAGGRTGWANPFAFVRAVRAMFDGPIVLAGGLSDGTSLRAATVLGCTLGYMGTRFIASRESMASEHYKQMVVDASMDDIVLTRAFTDLPSNWLRPSIAAAGIDVDALVDTALPRDAATRAPGQDRPARWVDIWSAGHSTSGVRERGDVASIVAQLQKEYAAAA